MAKATSDEQIIAAMLTHGTIKESAAAAGISERALYDRMNKGDFQALYKAAKADIIRAALFSINGNLQAAINTISEIMTNTENNPATRLQAAQTILNTACKFTQRLENDEQTITKQIESNRFGLW